MDYLDTELFLTIFMILQPQWRRRIVVFVLSITEKKRVGIVQLLIRYIGFKIEILLNSKFII